MMVLGRTMKVPEDPVFKALVGFLGVIAACISTAIGAWVYMDDRYQHKAEALILVAAQDAKLDDLRVQIEWSADRNSKRYIEDQLFKLEQIPSNKVSDNERAQMQKYKRDLRELIDVWVQKGKPLR